RMPCGERGRYDGCAYSDLTLESIAMSQSLNWGILGTGRIAGTLANAIRESRTGQLLAVGSRTQASADRFGGEHGVARAYSTYQVVLVVDDVQAVYVAVPYLMRAGWSTRRAEAGRRMLCEQPLPSNVGHARALLVAVRALDVFC